VVTRAGMRRGGGLEGGLVEGKEEGGAVKGRGRETLAAVK